MSWFRPNRNDAGNRRRSTARDPILMVSARVSEHRQERLHKIGALVLLLLAVGGTVWTALAGVNRMGAWFFSENEQFAIRQLDLQSDGRLKPAHLREYAGLSEGQNLFALDLGRVRRDLEGVPLVKSVEIRRQLPDTLVVRVGERTALAKIGLDDRTGHLALDRDGCVLGPTSRSPHLPAVTGLNDRGLTPGGFVEEPSVRHALDLLNLCDTTPVGGLVQVASVDVRESDHLVLTLRSGAKVPFPYHRMEGKLQDLAGMLRDAEEKGQAVVSVDMTVDRNPPMVVKEPTAGRG